VLKRENENLLGMNQYIKVASQNRNCLEKITHFQLQSLLVIPQKKAIATSALN
jgi:hypothetical protein